MEHVERRGQSRIYLMRKVLKSVLLLNPYMKEEITEGEILNMSSSGLCLRVTKPLKQLEVLKVMIPPSKDLPRIPTIAEVRWLNPHTSKTESFDVGMRFII